ncbi:HK97-gp10 family putative phage morphogenesis protein [Phaeobacter sp. NW0010-22]|uniref:HK97-gp10 family putative phage morphogenesis protein n=1 Tax=Phaeobacter sp. NW0010-22 TaxID=3135907 RepID=UPI0031098020
MVQGLDRFNRRWQAIPKNARINVRAAMEDAATDIVEEMASRAPYLEGELQASIGWTWGEAPKGSLTIGSVGGTNYGALRITIYVGGGDAFHARFQEFGTANMPANPFFFPVWRARRKRVKGQISRALSKSIRDG